MEEEVVDSRMSRISLKEPPPPYKVEDRRNSSSEPLSPTTARRVSRWSLSKAPKRQDSKPLESPSSLTGATLNAANLDVKLFNSDLKFANVIIQLMTPKLEEGHLSYLEGTGWGFTFTDETVENPHYKKCALDKMLGFNAYAYKKRFPKVEDLVCQDLETRGLEVKFIEICISDVAIGVKWIIEI